MDNQHFSVTLQKENPAVSGFSLKFAAADQQSQNAAFASGLADFTVRRILFGVSGVNFSGLNVLTDTDASSLILDQVDFNIKITGGIPSVVSNNSGALNVEEILVFTGDSENDTNLTNLAVGQPNFTITTNVEENFDINFSLSKQDLGSNTGVIFYRLVPVDRIASGKASDITSGQLFTGFAALPTEFTNDIFISRSNLNDIRFRASKLVMASGATGVRIDSSGIVSDFTCGFELRTNQEVTISGIDNSVTFVNPPTTTIPTTGVSISGNFEVFTLEKDTAATNNYIVRKTN